VWASSSCSVMMYRGICNTTHTSVRRQTRPRRRWQSNIKIIRTEWGDRLCALVVRVPGSIPDATRFPEK
jgi:hypothetical protein